jgi:murein DD-endopeptidase MepM/ murein hydrolase activator NlpD
MKLADRLPTIAVTAALTSAVWIVIGTAFIDRPRSTSAEQQPGHPPPSFEPAASGPGPSGIGSLTIPVAGARADQLSDTFADERGGGSRLHEALDIMAARGTAVVAAAPGRIEKLFHSDAGGNTIYVRSPDRRTIHYYAHLDHYAPGLKEGQTVARGQVIGAVGSTGDASPEAPHLHFEIIRTTPDAEWYEPGTPIDPYPLLTGKTPSRP